MLDRNLIKLPGMRGIMAMLALLALVQAGLVISQGFFLADAITRLWSMQAVSSALGSAFAFLGCFIALQIVRFFQESLLDRYSLKQAKALRSTLLCDVFDERKMIAHTEGAASVANVASDGMNDVQAYIRIMPPKLIGIAAISITLLACEFVIDWPSGVILTIMIPVIVSFMILLGHQARERSERQYASYTRLTNRFMDTLRGISTIRAFGAGDREGQAVYTHSENLRNATVRTLTTATLSSAVLDFCATFGVAAVAMMLAFRLMDGSIDLRTGLLALILAPECLSPIRAFASDYHASLDGKNALAAALAMIERADARASLNKAEQHGRLPHDNTSQEEGIQSWDASSHLTFEGVAYHYEDGEGGVSDVTFSLDGYEKVGIVGESGAGKSTIANLVAGFQAPSDGTISINGRPADLRDRSWKRHVRYIPQHPYIFRGTIDENVRFYKVDATRQQVENAIKAVGLDALLADLPQGLDTLIGDGGRGLSGGEAHRVALARVLLDDQARVLVFDEPTAHLDIETELELKAPMLEAMRGKLVVLATHRLHWLDDMDRTITLGNAHILSKEADDARR